MKGNVSKRYYVSPSNARKKLKMGDVEFFTAALLKFGKPWLDPNNEGRYWPSKHHSRMYGIAFYFQEAFEGQQFAKFVQQCGDAKARAADIYIAWHKWYKDQEEK